jgi:hypothetical protein
MPMFKRACVVLALVAASACNSPSIPTPTTSSVAVTGTVDGGQTSQFTAKATLSNGTVQDVTATATWASSDTAIATVTSGGLVKITLQSGTADITATYQGKTGLRSVSFDCECGR